MFWLRLRRLVTLLFLGAVYLLTYLLIYLLTTALWKSESNRSCNRRITGRWPVFPFPHYLGPTKIPGLRITAEWVGSANLSTNFAPVWNWTPDFDMAVQWANCRHCTTGALYRYSPDGEIICCWTLNDNNNNKSMLCNWVVSVEIILRPQVHYWHT